MTGKNSTRLKAGASILALTLVSGLVAVAPALAQDAPAAAPADDENVVVVTGQRAQLKSAQKLKRDSDVVQDSVTAVDIGALPDRSVAEALQRISGLQIQRANEARDPIRMTAEGGGVNIRGLSWVRSETNGRDIFSARNGRALSWDDVSADLLAGIDVFKNPSADMIEGGIGGTINLRTRLPFDQRGRLLAFTMDSTYGDLQESHHQSGSLIYSDRWDTSIGELGLLINYSAANVGNETHVVGVDRYNSVTVGSSNRFVPNTLGWRTIDWKQKREAIAAAVQWRPVEGLEFTLQAFNSVATPKNTEYNVGFYNDSGEIQGGATATGSDYTYNANGEFQSGTIKGAGITANTRYGEDRKETTDLSLGFRWNATDRLQLSGDLQYVKSTADILSNTVFVQYCETQVRTTGCDPADKVTAHVDITGDLPSIVINEPNLTGDQSSYYWAAAMDHVEKNEGEQVAWRLDGQYDFDDDGWLKSFKFGVRATDRDYITRQSNWNWGYLSHQYWGSGGGAGAVYLDEAGGFDLGWTSQPANANLPNESELVTFDGFMHGSVPVPGNIWFPAASLVNQGTDYTFDQLKHAETGGWGWAPASTNWDSYASNGGLNTQNEKTKAAYGLLKFGHDDVFGAQTLDGNIGVRVVKTTVSGDSYVVMGTLSAPAGQTCVGDCTLYNKVVSFGAGTTFPYGGVNEYTDTLPSLNIRYRYNDELQFRFAASKAVVRPDLSWLSPYTTLSAGGFVFNQVPATTTFTVDSSNATFTGTGGSPTLEPIRADQFDLTAEWYFAPTGSLTLALFQKKLSNYIYVQSGIESYSNNGVTLDFNVNRYVNGSETGDVSGWELAYQQFYDFLPAPWNGLGIQANYTKIDSSGGRNPVASVLDGNQVTNANLNSLPLEGMSPESYNFAVMYEKYGISARMAYNWRSDYLLTTSAANVNRPMWAQAYGQWDGSVFYDLNQKFKVGVQVTNLGRDVNYIRVSSDITRPLDTQYYSATKTDKRVSLVVRGKF
ncbi:tonB-dependent receptor family protein [Asticcacaulis biprosthecium C19]|uniref:TonB-dependent receptor family protein n=1 Tax=Asticcacaulis biprosthecium C19 TaxID=715226 RepID=F4QGE8_9CAUL|nr:TonB-dependent receptor [Asticcacaulis biprosthecium]EGF93629.1 tonB-dependent receptor family protein [Asticcacaulis biprosthecium C19]